MSEFHLKLNFFGVIHDLSTCAQQVYLKASMRPNPAVINPIIPMTK